MLVVLVVACLFAVGASSASAAQKRILESSFGNFSSPQGLAFDQSSGDVYVADSGNARIEKFDPSGNLLLGFGANVGGAGVNTCTTSCEPGTPGSGPGEFNLPKFVAVDNDPTSASFHDVYVADVGDGVVSKFDPSGQLVTSWGGSPFPGAINGSTTGEGSFGQLAGVAVESNGDLLVLGAFGEFEGGKFERARAFTFTEAGGFVEQVEVPRVSKAQGVAVDPAGDFFKVNGNNSVEKISPAGAQIGTVTFEGEPVTEIAALAVDPASGDLYTASVTGTIDHYAFNGAGEVIEGGGATCALVPSGEGCAPTDTTIAKSPGSGIAVSESSGATDLSDPSSGQIDRYSALVTVPDVTTLAAGGVGPTTATLKGSVDPDSLALTECRFEYVSDAAIRGVIGSGYAELVGSGVSPELIFQLFGVDAPCEEPTAAEVGAGSAPVPVHADLTGLNEGDTYHFRLAAANANGPNLGGVEAFITVTPPTIDGAKAENLTPTSVDLTASINPDHGDTTYRFEYGTDPGYGTSIPVPDQDIGSGASDVAVSQHVTGLIPGATYHWRVVATNSALSTVGADHTFVYATNGTALPDGRAYEMVTPVAKNAALLSDLFIFGRSPLISADGDRVMASAIQCFPGAESCNALTGDITGSPLLFERTSAGWSTTALAPSAAQFPNSVPAQRALAVETGAAIFSMQPTANAPSSLFLRSATGILSEIGPNVPPGNEGPHYGEASGATQAQTNDLSHLVLENREGPYWPFDETLSGSGIHRSLYEWVGTGDSAPLLVGVTGAHGSHSLVSVCGTAMSGASSEALSESGKTVYFEAVGPCASGSDENSATSVPATAIYARIDGESEAAHTVAISARSASECTGACLASPPAAAQLNAASSDGDQALFTSTQQLTDSAGQDPEPGDTAAGSHCPATVGPNGCNLYLHDFTAPAGHELTAISAGDLSGGGPRVQGVVGFSADGTHAYFVAEGVLTSTPNGFGQTPVDGADNLYLFERDAAYPSGRLNFITTLPGSHGEPENWETAPRPNVTPDGRFLVFSSYGRLTPDDTSRSGAAQIFRYDANTGALNRISVGENGFNDDGNRPEARPCGISTCSEDASIAPAHTLDVPRRDPTMSDDGSFVFFQSPVALAPGAADDLRIGTEEGVPVFAQNVYEWHDGHVYLISDGRDASIVRGHAPNCQLSSVCLLGSDSSGANVFFSTASPLVGADTNTQLDIYDAHICSAGSPCFSQEAPSTKSCVGDACQGTQAPPPPTSTATSTAPTSGNVAPTPRSDPRRKKLAKALKKCRTSRKGSARKTCEKAARNRFRDPRPGQTTRKADR